MAGKESKEPNENLIDHKDNMCDAISKLCISEDYADVIFIVDNKRFPAHRSILAVSNEYFRALLYGGFSETKSNEIKLDVDSSAFGIILKYIYTGLISVSVYDDDLLIKTLNLATEYGFEQFVNDLIENLIENRLKCDNALAFATCANLNSFTSFFEECLYTIDEYSEDIIQQTSFGLLSKDLLCKIISRDDFIVNELQLFNAVMALSEGRTMADLKEVLSHVRFTLMQIHELQSIVEPLGVLQANEIAQVIKEIKTSNCLPYRAGNLHRNQLECNVMANATEYGYEWKNDTKKMLYNGCLFKMSSEKTINYIQMELRGRCSYYIEVSRDQREWLRIVDYTGYYCSGTQNLYFKLQPIGFIYIYIIEKHPETSLDKLVTKYKFLSVPMVKDGAIAPTDNCVKKSFKDILPIADSIVVEFSQPFYINYLWLKLNSNANCQVMDVKTKLNICSNPETFIFKRDHIGECYFFKAHIASQMIIKFNRDPQIGDIQAGAVFFHHENPDQLSIKSNKD